MERLLACNGKTLQSGHSPKVSLVEPKIPLQEIFDWVSSELKARESSSACARTYGSWGGQQDSRSKGREETNPTHHRSSSWERGQEEELG